MVITELQWRGRDALLGTGAGPADRSTHWQSGLTKCPVAAAAALGARG